MNATMIEKAIVRPNIQSEVLLQVYGKVIDEGLLQLASLPGVSQSNIDNCNSLRADILEWIDTELNTRQSQVTEPTAGWCWRPRVDTKQARIGFLTLHENKPVPIHDHPGSSGLLIVMEGKLKVQLFERSDSSVSTRRITELIRTEEHEAGPGEFVIIGSDHGNIHSVRATEGPCIVLDILLSPYSERERGWYMPIDDSSTNQKQVRTMRVSRSNSNNPETN